MSEKAKDGVVLRDFPGLATQPDALDVNPGAAVIQTNLQSDADGQLRTRSGVKQVTFEED
jgi:hypothetical protein